MRILKSVQTKVCVDGSVMKEFFPDKPLSESFLKLSEQSGTVKFLNQLKKPYFTCEKEQIISIRGFIRNSSVKVQYKKELQGLVADYFCLLLYYYDHSMTDISSLGGHEDSIPEKMNIRFIRPPGRRS